MPKRSDGNETPKFRVPTYGDSSTQVTFDVGSDSTALPGTLGEFDFLNAYTLCPNGINPQNVTGIILRMLQLHFSNADYINREDLKTYLWSSDRNASKIKISPATRYNQDEANQLPALIVKRGSIQSSRQVIGDHSRVDTAGEDRGEARFYRLVQGTHYVACASESDAQAELLAMEVFDTISWASPIMRSNLPFMDFQVTGISELTLLDALGNKVGVQVQMNYAFEYGWQTTQVSVPAARFGLSLSGQNP